MPTEQAPRIGSARGSGRTGIGIGVLAVLLAGCATRVDVRPMATGRADVTAYELNGADVLTLRQQARRLCPLGGEVVREAGHSLPPEADAGRWRSTLGPLVAWAESPVRPAQLLVVCRKGGDHDKLQSATAGPHSAPHAGIPRADAVTAALPVGPINPEW